MKIIAIVEFGSSARADNDQYSDRDFFILIDEWESREEIIEEAIRILPLIDSDNSEFIINDLNSFDFMLKRGSLFLWHLKLEAKVHFGEKEFNEKITTLQVFDNYEGKYHNYLGVFEDLKAARKELPKTSAFDYSTLFTVIRNLSILVCYRLGSPKFGRTSAFRQVKDSYPSIDFSLDEYMLLQQYKLQYERGFHVQKPGERNIEEWIAKVEQFSIEVKSILDVQ